jgi:hypothetical protein
MSSRIQPSNDGRSVEVESMVQESNEMTSETNKYRFRETSLRLRKIKTQQQQEIGSDLKHKKITIKRGDLASKIPSPIKTKKRRRMTIASSLTSNGENIENNSNQNQTTRQNRESSNKSRQSLTSSSNKVLTENKPKRRGRRKTIASNELLIENNNRTDRNSNCPDVFEFTDENDDLVYQDFSRKNSLFSLNLARNTNSSVNQNNNDKLSAINLNKQHSLSLTKLKRHSLNVASSLNKSYAKSKMNHSVRVEPCKRKGTERDEDDQDVHVDIECDEKEGDNVFQLNSRNSSKMKTSSTRNKYSSVGGSETCSNNSNEVCDDDCSNTTNLSLSSSNTILPTNNSCNHVNEQQNFLNKLKRIKP